jgi:transcription antitermination factor nusB
MNSNENNNDIKLPLTRKKQRQNAMQMIYQMDIKDEFDFNKKLNLDNKYQDIKEEITLENISEHNNFDYISKLIIDFSKEKLAQDFDVKEYLEEDGKIIYEVVDSYYNTQIDSQSFENIQYLKDVISAFVQNREKINEIIKQVLSDKWKMNRLAKIDLAILRTAITEIKYVATPYKVAINEALELSKKFSDEKSTKFINGVLKDYVKIFEEEK